MLLGNVLPQSYGNHRFLVRVSPIHGRVIPKQSNFWPVHPKQSNFRPSQAGSNFRMDLAVWVRWDVGDTLRHLKYEGRIVEKRFRDLFSFIFWRETRFLYLESAYACVNAPKLRWKNWIKYDENPSSDARRGHLRTSKFPNFSKGESFPLWPPLSLRRRRWVSLCGIRARQLAIFFTVCQLLDCGIVSLNYDVFILGLPLHNIPKNIYILTQTGASPQAWLMEAPT